MKKFAKNNESFVCENCGKNVEKHPTSSRDHCTYCLYGKHVDINPGDRSNKCRGILRPIGLKISNGKEKIMYRCENCSKIVNCIVAIDDSREEIIKLSNKTWRDE